MNIKISNANQPSWRVVTVKSHIPEALKKLDELAHNLWWSWNTEARDLFASLDEDLWRKVGRNPIEMLRSGSVGEKPPKANWLFAIAGIVLLGIGYWMAQTIENPINALSNFFLAVVLVILGTFLLFMAVSVVVCKLLQKNKTYYYKTNHFISVGTMVYRMKRNGAGLAFICILSTMVLVTVSTTSCLYFGQDRGLKELYGREVQVTRTVAIDNGAVLEDSQSLVEAALTENGYTI